MKQFSNVSIMIIFEKQILSSIRRIQRTCHCYVNITVVKFDFLIRRINYWKDVETIRKRYLSVNFYRSTGLVFNQQTARSMLHRHMFYTRLFQESLPWIKSHFRQYWSTFISKCAACIKAVYTLIIVESCLHGIDGSRLSLFPFGATFIIFMIINWNP